MRTWVPDKKDVWVLAYQVGTNEEEGTVTVEPLQGGEPVVIKAADCHPFDPSHDLNLEDASLLNNLHEVGCYCTIAAAVAVAVAVSPTLPPPPPP